MTNLFHTPVTLCSAVLTVVAAQAVCSASLGQQGAEPGGLQPAQPEAAQAQRAVVQVQAQTAQQLDDGGPVAAPHAHGQSAAQVLLVGATAQQQLHQLQGPATLTHLDPEDTVRTSRDTDIIRV